jgi:hypothetical protein
MGDRDGRREVATEDVEKMENLGSETLMAGEE